MRRGFYLDRGIARRFALMIGAVICFALLSFSPALASAPSTDSEVAAAHALAGDSLDLEDHGGFSGEYVFGMTKSVMRSTLTPALKPAALIFTIPLDLVTLPFAVVGGFLR